jgi:hypothetical protein
MLIYKLVSKMRKLQAQGLTQEQAASQLGITTHLGGVGILRPNSTKKK